MNYISYFESNDKEKLLNFLENAKWGAGKFLANVIKENTFYEKYGKDANLYFYIQNGEPIEFGAIVEQDYIERPNLKPWIALIYVDPKARGQRLSEKMVYFLESKAKELGYNQVNIVSQHKGLYEKYGYNLQEEIYDSKHDVDYRYNKEIWEIDTNC